MHNGFNLLAAQCILAKVETYSLSIQFINTIVLPKFKSNSIINEPCTHNEKATHAFKMTATKPTINT